MSTSVPFRTPEISFEATEPNHLSYGMALVKENPCLSCEPHSVGRSHSLLMLTWVGFFCGLRHDALSGYVTYR
jgi:hypothetical protein